MLDDDFNTQRPDTLQDGTGAQPDKQDEMPQANMQDDAQDDRTHEGELSEESLVSVENGNEQLETQQP